MRFAASWTVLVAALALASCGDDGAARDRPAPAPAAEDAGPSDAAAVPEAMEVVPAPVPAIEVPELIGPESGGAEPPAAGPE